MPTTQQPGFTKSPSLTWQLFVRRHNSCTSLHSIALRVENRSNQNTIHAVTRVVGCSLAVARLVGYQSTTSPHLHAVQVHTCGTTTIKIACNWGGCLWCSLAPNTSPAAVDDLWLRLRPVGALPGVGRCDVTCNEVCTVTISFSRIRLQLPGNDLAWNFAWLIAWDGLHAGPLPSLFNEIIKFLIKWVDVFVPFFESGRTCGRFFNWGRSNKCRKLWRHVGKIFLRNQYFFQAGKNYFFIKKV